MNEISALRIRSLSIAFKLLVLSIFLAGLVLAGSFLAGCAAFQTSTTQNLPTVIDEKPTADKALIIVEGTQSYGSLIKLYAIKLRDDKTLVGKVGPNGKLVWLRDPGRMVLTLGDDLYGTDWCQGRIQTVEAGKAYKFNIENIGGAYSIAGQGMSIEDEQTWKLLTNWKLIKRGMSVGEVVNLMGGATPDRVKKMESMQTSTHYISWYKLDFIFKYEQGKLSEWAIICPNPNCKEVYITPIETTEKDNNDLKYFIKCPFCGHQFFPAVQTLEAGPLRNVTGGFLFPASK